MDINPKDLQQKLAEGIRAMNRIIVGNSEAVHLTVAAICCQRDMMLTSFRGRGKTALGEAAKYMIEGASFMRHQCTPQSRPSDITGIEIFDEETKKYKVRWSPMMDVTVGLWDEINRADEEFQSGLMEVAEDGKATVAGELRHLPDPYLRLYTRNPDGQAGTYRLADPTRDRILFDVDMKFPDEDSMTGLFKNTELHRGKHTNKPFVNMDEVKWLREFNDHMVAEASPEVMSYAYRLAAVMQVDSPEFRKLNLVPQNDLQKKLWADLDSQNIYELQILDDGISTRGLIWLLHGACALAFLDGEEKVRLRDVQRAWEPAARHKLIMRPSARAMGIAPEDILRAARAVVKP